MNQNRIPEIRRDIVAIGRLLWEKDLTAGRSGNISARVDEQFFLITASQTCLGLLREYDIVCMDVNGACENEDLQPSSEWRLHAAIYQQYPECKSIVHVHAFHTNVFFLKNDQIEPKILEAKHVLGDVPVVMQSTMNVEDCEAVVKVLKENQIVVLKNHGCLAMGKDLFECFVLLQTLEEAAKTAIISTLYNQAV